MRAATAFLLLLGCGSKSGLVVPGLPDSTDASVAIEDAAPDVGPGDAGVDAAACADPPCDCFAEGRVVWDHVEFCGRGNEIFACSSFADDTPGWGDLTVEASCRGRYTVCGRVESRAGCPIAEVCGEGQIRRVGNLARIAMRGFRAEGGECLTEALEDTGGRLCVDIRWEATDGTRGETELGCFANFGPFCFGVFCGGGGGGDDGASGMWEF
ncbi:MAG: hypothetical protein AAGE52_40820 [Myxococcota bacterium]